MDKTGKDVDTETEKLHECGSRDGGEVERWINRTQLNKPPARASTEGELFSRGLECVCVCVCICVVPEVHLDRRQVCVHVSVYCNLGFAMWSALVLWEFPDMCGCKAE